MGSAPYVRCLSFLVFTTALTLLVLLCSGSALSRQQSEGPREEIVANLDAGRVIIAVVRDEILVATIENRIEAETRPPIPVQLSSERLAVTLGAVDWFSPSSQQTLVNISAELPHLRSNFVHSGPHLQQAEAEGEASDIEAIGQGVMERLNDVAHDLHNKIQQTQDEPLTELIVADFLTGYGPEVWQVTFGVEQEQQQGDFWDTRVLRPKYLQFWPPEKGQPHTLLEFAYPPDNPPTPLLDLIRQKDSKLQKIIGSEPTMAAVANQFLAGDSKKIGAEDAMQFLRAAVSAIAGPHDRQTFATIGQESGFAWVLPPPPEATKLGAPAQQQNRPADAPSLIKHPDPQ